MLFVSLLKWNRGCDHYRSQDHFRWCTNVFSNSLCRVGHFVNFIQRSFKARLNWDCVCILKFPQKFPQICFGKNKIGPRAYKSIFMLNSAEHGIFSANKYENANSSWHFHIYKQRKSHAKLCLARKNSQLSVISDLLAWQISCSVSWTWTSFITSGPGLLEM